MRPLARRARDPRSDHVEAAAVDRLATALHQHRGVGGGPGPVAADREGQVWVGLAGAGLARSVGYNGAGILDRQRRPPR